MTSCVKEQKNSKDNPPKTQTSSPVELKELCTVGSSATQNGREPDKDNVFFKANRCFS